ncbi:hypothetical protein EXIGLDRAFT_769122 [Exidia glandulosa HHB12029]|uniref:Uncharacterized protein n=1 Tax=Exidia glandulosa HHB12029 TaxID=1314781 RepID=A0A165HP22_EXIGL|nr:hypothetical protein EXIGLDRAFT_769122 [Exidia glandulosa HHB12029]
MFSMRGRRDHPDSASAGTTQGPALPDELLLHVFSFLAVKPFGRDGQTAWAAGYDTIDPNYITPRSSALFAALHVSRSWHATAAELFYAEVYLATVNSCVLFSRTIKRNPALAKLVQKVVFPRETQILSAHPNPGLDVKLLIGKLAVGHGALSTAVKTIVQLCINLEHCIIRSGATSRLLDHFGVVDLAPRLVELDMIATTTWSKNPLAKRSLRQLARTPLSLDCSAADVSFPRLQTLHLILCDEIRDCGPSLRRTFPALRQLFLSSTWIEIGELVPMLCALQDTLRVLGFSSVHDPADAETPDMLTTLDKHLPVTNLQLDELRLTYLGYIPWPNCLVNIARQATLRVLHIDSSHLHRFWCLPPRLDTLVVYQDTVGSNMCYVLGTAGILKHALPGWVETSPSLRLISVRCAMFGTDNYYDYTTFSWAMVAVLLRPFCDRYNVHLNIDLLVRCKLGHAATD